MVLPVRTAVKLISLYIIFCFGLFILFLVYVGYCIFSMGARLPLQKWQEVETRARVRKMVEAEMMMAGERYVLGRR